MLLRNVLVLGWVGGLFKIPLATCVGRHDFLESAKNALTILRSQSQLSLMSYFYFLFTFTFLFPFLRGRPTPLAASPRRASSLGVAFGVEAFKQRLTLQLFCAPRACGARPTVA